KGNGPDPGVASFSRKDDMSRGGIRGIVEPGPRDLKKRLARLAREQCERVRPFRAVDDEDHSPPLRKEPGLVEIGLLRRLRLQDRPGIPSTSRNFEKRSGRRSEHDG